MLLLLLIQLKKLQMIMKRSENIAVLFSCQVK